MNVDLVRIFVKVVQNNSFTKAGEALKIPKSTISKAMTELETETGTKLLVRTTRSLTLTAAGKAFYDNCLGPIQAIEDAQKSLYGSDNLLVGNMRITAPEDLGTEVIAPAVGELTRKHQGLSFELLYTQDIVDLVRDGFDMAIRIGDLKESGLKVKKIGDVKLVLIASPEYLKEFGKITSPEDLKEHQCLALGGRVSHKSWALKSDKGSTKINVSPRIASNQMSSILRAAISGAGIALVPSFLAHPHIQAGKIKRVLPHWTSHGLPVSMLSPLAFSASARLRMTSDHLFAHLQKALTLI